MDEGQDIFTGEDKPASTCGKVVSETVLRNERLRVASSEMTAKKLPHCQLFEYFEYLTAFWHENILLVHGTRKIVDIFVHFEASSLTPNDYHGLTAPKDPEYAGRFLSYSSWNLPAEISGSVDDGGVFIKGNNETQYQGIIKNHMPPIDDGSRPPMHLLDKDDSLELDEDDLARCFRNLKMRRSVISSTSRMPLRGSVCPTLMDESFWRRSFRTFSKV